MVLWGVKEVKKESFKHFGTDLWGNLGRTVGFCNSSWSRFVTPNFGVRRLLYLQTWGCLPQVLVSSHLKVVYNDVSFNNFRFICEFAEILLPFNYVIDSHELCLFDGIEYWLRFVSISIILNPLDGPVGIFFNNNLLLILEHSTRPQGITSI